MSATARVRTTFESEAQMKAASSREAFRLIANVFRRYARRSKTATVLMQIKDDTDLTRANELLGWGTRRLPMMRIKHDAIFRKNAKALGLSADQYESYLRAKFKLDEPVHPVPLKAVPPSPEVQT